ncbi:3-hydroxyacyl-ACP dehydratase FabZ family protein [Aquimarina brevivitae]|uniref:3-hydroxyacyl-[acyl-carrier-protein] dehydratase n=1 Tax=Aquimarina brevivitae TaxID=323412 RepID=A0A4Q7P1U3_9FLAO|nr:3-hydroxyacyl-ACP dehydratase FabZ family protein [Aquimarina brevivitae]RZS93833.1 3-hydroxyacyl-[acyl-carrier-protein] dehydratase [Aquimarina brevivitae]
MNKTQILKLLPYDKPFLFVDKIVKVDDSGIIGKYTFTEDEFFYPGHFKNNPITPGVILTECMAQIGLACLGLFLIRDWVKDKAPNVAMTSNDIHYYKPVLPKETVVVTATKEYFRFNKLKCAVTMTNESNEIVAKGTVSGMVIK